MNDRDFLLAVLQDRCWHTWNEIMQRSQRERGHGLTVHSRAAELRRRLRVEGLTIECKTGRKNGRGFSEYRLVSLDETEASPQHEGVPSSALPASVSSSEPEPSPCESPGGADEQMHGVRDDTGSLNKITLNNGGEHGRSAAVDQAVHGGRVGRVRAALHDGRAESADGEGPRGLQGDAESSRDQLRVDDTGSLQLDLFAGAAA